MEKKPIVFVITPFGEDFMALYDELKNTFENDFEFTNGGDLDNQQNILQDIVEGIYRADVIIADLTGLNPNVFYELGLAHAMNKKVIIITQDLDELPFDIKSYRANEYDLKFNKMPKFKEELTKLLKGAIKGTVKYGNPVTDYIPQFEISKVEKASSVENNNVEVMEDEEDDKGVLDFLVDIEERSNQMTREITTLGDELSEMNESLSAISSEVERVKSQSGSVNVAYTRKICRKMAEPVDVFASKLKIHVDNITTHWSIIENSFLSILDNPHAQTKDNYTSLSESIVDLNGMQRTLDDSNEEVEDFVEVLRGTIGIERRLNKAMNSLINQLENYLSMIKTIMSSIDRITSKSEIIKKNIDNIKE